MTLGGSPIQASACDIIGGVEELGVVERAFAAFNRRDEAAFVSAMHPDIVFVPLLTPAAAGPYRGREGMRRYLRDASSLSARGRIELDELTDHGDVVLVGARIVLPADAQHEQRSVAVSYVVRLDGGLITALVTVAQAAPDVSSRADATETLAMQLPAEPISVPAIRRAVRAYAAAAGCPDLDGIALAVTEAATNVVLHAYLGVAPEAIDIRCSRVGADLVVSVGDTGRGLLPRLDSPGLGLGLAIMQHHARELTFIGPPQRDRGTEVRMLFACAQRVPIADR